MELATLHRRMDCSPCSSFCDPVTRLIKPAGPSRCVKPPYDWSFDSVLNSSTRGLSYSEQHRICIQANSKFRCRSLAGKQNLSPDGVKQL